jgi:resuscitation-promoting factor RpfB
VGVGAIDDALRRRCRTSLERSRERRAQLRKLRRRRLRARGGTLALAAVLVCVSVAGAGVALGGSTGVVLKRGDRGAAVVAVQRKLRINADGVFGPLTERAVKRFQRRRGLRVDGVVGPATRRALGLQAFSRRSVYRGTSGGSPSGDPLSGSRRVALPAVLVRIARCESGGNPRAVSRDGRYRGKYQFLRSTWRALGGTGDPAAAPEWRQDQLALRLYRRRGTAPWANCA